MKEKNNNLISILNLILLIIILLLMIICMYIIFFKKDEANNMELEKENSFENTVYYEFEGKIVGTRKLEISKTYDINTTFGRYGYIYANGIPSLDKVSSSIKEGTLTKSGVTIIITDKNEKPYGYSKKWYLIEKKKDEEWEKLNLKKDMVISEEEDTPTIYSDISEFSIDWTEYYGELEKGTYRIAKKTYIYNSNDEGVYVYTEFKIK